MQTIAAPTVTPENTPTWLTGANDFLSNSLNLWMQYEQIQDVKESQGTAAQKEINNVVETTAPNTNAQGQSAQAQQTAAAAGEALQTAALTLGGVLAGIAVLYYLTR